MLISLLRTYLAPYRAQLAGVLVLQLISVIAMLYLPSLNADLIDDGVTKGDIGYIWTTGLWMLAVSCVQIVASSASVYQCDHALGWARLYSTPSASAVSHRSDTTERNTTAPSFW